MVSLQHQEDEPQKAHPTSEFVIIAQNGGCGLLRFTSRLVTVVRQAGSLKPEFYIQKKFYIQPPISF